MIRIFSRLAFICLAFRFMAPSAAAIIIQPVVIQTVHVGDVGNASDTNGMGAVKYRYSIGEFDVTTAQYTAFLNAVAATDTNGLYNPSMGTDFPRVGISRSGVSGSYTYAVIGNGNVPVNDMTWGSVARFCNWLQNGQPVGPEGPGTTETGSYTLNGAVTRAALMAVTRNPGAGWVIPTVDEWYKAAYYKGGGTNAGYWIYPTQSNTPPINTLPDTGNHANFFDQFQTGNGGYTDPVNFLTPVGAFNHSPGVYGTFDQGGDLFQWEESVIVAGAFRGIEGASYTSSVTNMRSSTFPFDGDPTISDIKVGFRVALVPEPSTALLTVAAVVLLWRKLRAIAATTSGNGCRFNEKSLRRQARGVMRLDQ